MLKTKLSLLFGFVCLVFLQAEDVNGIINGTDASPGEFPFAVSLQRSKKHFCGGAIINKRFIVTAASCVVGDVKSPGKVSLQVGFLRLNGKLASHDVNQIILHEFEPSTSKNNIALLKLKQPLVFDAVVQAVTLPKSNLKDEKIIVTGWGSTSTHSGMPADILQKVELSIKAWTYCQKVYAFSKCQITPNNLCTESPQKGICKLDFGDPMTANGVLFGIASWKSSLGCAIPGKPDVYTDVSKYVKWIEENTSF